MAASGQTTPSHLYRKLATSNKCSVDDPESALQNTLSALAEQDDIFSEPNTDDEARLDWLVHAITCSNTEADQEKQRVPDETEAEYEWWCGARLIQVLLNDTQLTPFEIQSTANDSIVFSEGSRAHYVVCLLLCARSLQQCPIPITKRWKRWQSVICETIRNFQDCFRNDAGDLILWLWSYHMVPPCLHAISQLPPESHQVALLSALVGTTTELAASIEWETLLQESRLERLSETLTTILKTLSEHDETWLWLHPWREYAANSPYESSNDNAEHEDSDKEEDEHRQYKNDIVWWAIQVDHHESVAGMETRWNDLGLSMLAFVGLDNRSQKLQPVETWKVWFPHVSTILVTVVDPAQDLLPFLFIDKLLEIVPAKAVSSFTPVVKTPDSPLVTLQVLSNRILAPSRPNMSLEQKRKIRNQSDRIVCLMKALLDRYVTVQQVAIVKQLVIDCPHPGLKAKFLDFLRPVILEQENTDTGNLFWKYIGTFIEALVDNHLEHGRETLVNVDYLIENVEVPVGAVTMIELFVLAEKRLPLAVQELEGSIRSFHNVLEKSTQKWMNDASTVAPENCYRLNLLVGSLHHVLFVLDRMKGLE